MTAEPLPKRTHLRSGQREGYSEDHPSWIISSCGFESSWYPFDVTRTSCSRLQVPHLLVTDDSIVKTMSRCTRFSPYLPSLFGHPVPRRGRISTVLLPSRE